MHMLHACVLARAQCAHTWHAAGVHKHRVHVCARTLHVSVCLFMPGRAVHTRGCVCKACARCAHMHGVCARVWLIPAPQPSRACSRTGGAGGAQHSSGGPKGSKWGAHWGSRPKEGSMGGSPELPLGGQLVGGVVAGQPGVPIQQVDVDVLLEGGGQQHHREPPPCSLSAHPAWGWGLLPLQPSLCPPPGSANLSAPPRSPPGLARRASVSPGAFFQELHHPAAGRIEAESPPSLARDPQNLAEPGKKEAAEPHRAAPTRSSSPGRGEGREGKVIHGSAGR